MTRALYRKWRPQDWDEVVAQEHVIQTLKNAVVNDRVAHAYLFAGPRGTGKTTTARLLAKAVNCLEPDLAKRPCNACEHCKTLNAGRFMDLIEIDAASNTSVDDVRDLREKINFSPSQGLYKVYIIDEVHMLSTAAFNALLKTLEEPPPHAIFILATTEIHKIPATVLSRCQRHEFRRIPIDQIIQHLKIKCEEEGIHMVEAVFTEIARQATGSLRDAISLLDQLTSSNDKITLEMAQKVLGTATSMRVVDIVSALSEKKSSEGLSLIDQALDSGTDPRQLARQIVTYLRSILMVKIGNEDQIKTSKEVEARLRTHAGLFSMPALLNAIEAFNKATVEEHANWHPGLGLELAFTTFLTEPEPEQVQKSQSVKPPAPEQTGTPIPPVRQEPKTASHTPAPVEKAPETSKEDEKKAREEKPPAPKPAAKKNKRNNRAVISKEETAEVPETGKISLNQIHHEWAKVKSKVGKHNPRTEGLLNTSKLAGMKGNSLILGFSSETLKEMMEKEGNITLTMDILEEIFGQQIMVSCIVTTRQGSTLPEDLDIDTDGMVSTATRDLGGKISKSEELK
jgi:DNA polymerase-3 subunit gamma/tau